MTFLVVVGLVAIVEENQWRIMETPTVTSLFAIELPSVFSPPTVSVLYSHKETFSEFAGFT